jgi:hypothetical protein
MNPGSSLIEHEHIFDDLVQSLTVIRKIIEPDELIFLYINSLPAKMFGNWIQGQMAFIDQMTITEFKERVHEEAHRLNVCGLTQALSVERDPDTVQANIAKRIFFPKKGGKPQFPPCSHCGYNKYTEQNYHKHIAKHYFAKEAQKAQNPKRGDGCGRGRYRGKGGRHSGNGQGGGTANLADAGNVENNGKAPTYNSIFGGLAFCLKAATDSWIRKVRGVWIKDNGATHHMHHHKSLFLNYHPLKH